ncbi:hypothetical protein WN944_019708 [Citrus x changshan-huyou]|uniref:Uncharacterized protein n=1 Tax=Citrus x changshan-huyou TaxID=2935761 RepID=A0AAP0LYP8_9ROSI
MEKAITSAGLRHLKPLKNLRSLTLESCKVTANDIKRLQSRDLPNLPQIALSSSSSLNHSPSISQPSTPPTLTAITLLNPRAKIRPPLKPSFMHNWQRMRTQNWSPTLEKSQTKYDPISSVSQSQ